MKTSWVIPIALAILLSGCKDSERKAASTADIASEASTAKLPGSIPTEHGAWLGEGTFHATRGTQPVKAQLELLADGTYRFMVIEPRVLMVTVGIEKGTFKRADKLLHLTPLEDQKSTGSSLLAGAPKNFRPKSLSIEGNAFLLKDSQMDLRFEPNLKATAQLRKRGEI